MFKASGVTLTLCVLLVSAVRAQAPPPPPPSAAAAPKVELLGCVSRNPGTSGSFTLNESAGGTYRLTGKSVRKYAGRMVQLVGGPQSKKLSIRGGLWPSANTAAQAGAIDAAQASVARQPGGADSGTGGIELPEFHVLSVRRVAGSCE